MSESLKMPTILTHAVAALAVGKASAGAKKMPARFWLLSALCAILPDADVVGFSLGWRGSMLGHRGLSHSLFFALTLALLVAWLAFRKRPPFKRGWLVLYFFAVTASHGLLDALTDGGSGVAFFAPFDDARYFFPWRPIEVSPMGLRFFSPRGLEVIQSEFLWIWIPP